jgi:hypothetical protein
MLDNQNDEETGFDDGFGLDTNAATEGSPTETPVSTEVEHEANNEAVLSGGPEYVQLTKAERDELLALRQQQEKSFGTAFGKIGGIERTLQQLQAGSQIDIDQEDIDAFREDFPQIATALEKIKNLRAIPGSVDPNKLEELVQQRIAPALSAVEQKFEMRLLAKEHPDYMDIDKDPAFSMWVKSQPEEFQNNLAKASAEFDSVSVGDAISKFKSFRKTKAKEQAPQQKNRFSAAVTPRGSGTNNTQTLYDEFDEGFNGP